MPTYQIGDKTFETDGPLSDTDIDHIASQQAPAAPAKPERPPQPDAAPGELDPYGPNFNADKYKQWQDANPNALTEFGKSVAKGIDTTATGTANLLRTLRADTANNPETAQHARDMRDKSMQEYKQRMADNPAEVPSYSDIKNAHDVSMYVADKLGGMSKYVASYLMGGLPAVMGAGAIDAGQQEATNPDATTASVLTAGGLGAATGALPVPFLKGSGGPISQAARGFLLGGPLYGAAQGLTQNIPRAVATGDPAQGLPSKEQLIDSILGGSIGLGTFGGVHGAANRLTEGAPPSQLPPTAPAQAHADARLAERINDAANQNDYSLNKVAYNAGDGSKAALDTVHNGLSTDITSIWKEIRSTMPDPENVHELQQLSELDGIIKSARNKLKGRVGDDDLKALSDAVGHTEEGRALIDLVRQSNSLTDLYNGGLKGGVSRYTDYLNPLGHGGPENSYQSVLAKSAGVGGKVGVEGLALIHNPALWPVAAAQVAAFGAGRGIDALTGNRSTVARFVNDNSLAPQPVDMTGASSILRSRAQDAMAQSAQRLQAEQARNLNAASKQFDTQQQAAEASRLAQREQELRTQNRVDNNPGLGGFDRAIYDQTGVRPADAVPGVFELFRSGRITPSEFHGFFQDPKSLMAGNAGNHIVDMLDQMARKGQLPRDPEWSQQQTSNVSPNAPQDRTVYNPAAYAAQAAGNQARLVSAMDRVAKSEHSSSAKQTLNDAIAAIARSNNRADAEAVRQNAVQALSTHSPEAARYAHQELEPLVKQIRHATPETAVPKGSDLRAATTDVTRDGNALTRTLAAAYKLKNGINKPAYDGKIEPDQRYLKTVADFHDKAVHDPDSPAVKASYGALARETIAQFKSLGGLKVETWKGDGEPYRNSKEMMRDVSDSHHLWFLPTSTETFGKPNERTSLAIDSLRNTRSNLEDRLRSAYTHPGEHAAIHDAIRQVDAELEEVTKRSPTVGNKSAHPMLAPTGLKTVDGHPLLVNDVFRIVHDLYGHTQHGFQFGPVGEYNAFREHAQMYSDKALPALAAETLAQNAWVNFGAHLRSRDGSIPSEGEPGYVPPTQRPFSDQKAYAFPPELIARDPNIAREYIDTVAAHPEGAIKEGLDVSAAKPQLHDLIPGFKGIAQYLTPSERESVMTRTANKLVQHFTDLPSAKEMAAVAYSGRAKKGWYNRSANAIVSVFGQEDAPRFAALLAALSPQTDVETNFNNAVNVWRGWIEADRPKDETSIMRIIGENVEGDKGPGSVLPAWVPNSVRALIAPEGSGRIEISGPKVSSFMQNLLGEVNEVTNDTWMANWAGIQQTRFKGADRGASDAIGNVYGKGPGYLAMSALTRKASDILSKQTGETWTPAEVQETVWSWAKALYEKASSKQSANDIIQSQSLTHGDINSVPDFEMAFVKDTYARILDLAGYGDNVDDLKNTLDERASNAGSNGPGGTPFDAEGSGFSQAAFNKYLGASASRLDALRSGNDTGRVAQSADLGPGEDILARHPTAEAAQKVADALSKVRPTRVMPEADGRYAVVAGPKPQVSYPTAPLPEPTGYVDPEGRLGVASFVPGREGQGYDTPHVRALANRLSRVSEGGMAAPGQNGSYDAGNNTIRVYGGLSNAEHSRVLGHETGHAVEALSGLATHLKLLEMTDPSQGRRIFRELSDVSSLERPHLWSDEPVGDYSKGSVEEYRIRRDELFADALRHYLVDPTSMKKAAPTAARFIRDHVNKSNIGQIIAFASMAGLALPGIAQGLASLLDGGDQEDRS